MVHAGSVKIDKNIRSSANSVLTKASFKKTVTSTLSDWYSKLSDSMRFKLMFSVWSPSETRKNVNKTKTITRFHPFMNSEEATRHIEKFSVVDQGDVGGCSFASFVHLLSLYSLCDETVVKKVHSCILCDINDLRTKKNKFELFSKTYLKTLNFPDDGFNDWVHFLENFQMMCPEIVKSLHLVPLDLRGKVNDAILGNAKSHEKYIENIGKYIENKLDDGFAIGVPFLQHFIVLLGYSEDSFLVINSFGNDVGYGGLWVLGKENVDEKQFKLFDVIVSFKQFFYASINNIVIFDKPWVQCLSGGGGAPPPKPPPPKPTSPPPKPTSPPPKPTSPPPKPPPPKPTSPPPKPPPPKPTSPPPKPPPPKPTSPPPKPPPPKPTLCEDISRKNWQQCKKRSDCYYERGKGCFTTVEETDNEETEDEETDSDEKTEVCKNLKTYRDYQLLCGSQKAKHDVKCNSKTKILQDLANRLCNYVKL